MQSYENTAALPRPDGQAYIKRSEVLRQVKSGVMFDMEFITADRKRGTGGELISVKGWQLTGWNGMAGPGSGSKSDRHPLPMKEGKPLKGSSKNPNHDLHDTITIHNPGNKAHPITVHIQLIISFNENQILNG